MAQRLRNLRITRVDLVDAGDNPTADILLFKRRDAVEKADKCPHCGTVLKDGKCTSCDYVKKGADHNVNFEELLKSVPEAQRDALLKAHKAALEAPQSEVVKRDQEIQTLKADITKRDEQIAELKKSTNQTEDEVYKALPEGVRKRIEAAELKAKEAETVAKRLADETMTREFVAKAASFTALPVKAEEFGPVMKSLHAAAPEQFLVLEGVLKAANELISKGKVFTEIGSNAGGATRAWDQIVAKASERVTKSAGAHSLEKAIADVMRENPELYKAYQAELKGA